MQTVQRDLQVQCAWRVSFICVVKVEVWVGVFVSMRVLDAFTACAANCTLFSPISRHHFPEEHKLSHQESQGISLIHRLINWSLADLCMFTSVFTDLIVGCQPVEDAPCL